MEIKLKRGDVVRRSIAGARGFFYPDTSGRALVIKEDCVAHSQCGWQDCGDMSPYLVPTSAVSEKDRYEPGTNRMVVWVSTDG